MPDHLVTYENVKSSIKRWRTKNLFLPVSPISTEEILQQMRDDRIIKRFSTMDSERFIHQIPQSSVNAGKSFILFSHSILSLIGSACDACCDGTFKFFPSFFCQLYIIHVFIG